MFVWVLSIPLNCYVLIPRLKLPRNMLTKNENDKSMVDLTVLMT